MNNQNRKKVNPIWRELRENMNPSMGRTKTINTVKFGRWRNQNLDNEEQTRQK